jgi:hypothetical protein
VGQPTYLAAKANGDQSMSVKRSTPESTSGRSAPQDPRTMVKAVLPESQSPAMHHSFSVTVLDDGASVSGRVFLSRLLPPGGGHLAMSQGKGTNGTPTVRYQPATQRTGDCLRGASPMATEPP